MIIISIIIFVNVAVASTGIRVSSIVVMYLQRIIIIFRAFLATDISSRDGDPAGPRYLRIPRDGQEGVLEARDGTGQE